MTRRVVIIHCILLLAISCLSQQLSEPFKPASREQILRILELTGAKQNTAQMLGGMKQSAKQAMLNSIRSKQPSAPAAVMVELSGVLDQLFDSMTADEIVELIIPVYEKHMSTAEADAVIRFYSSPEGASFVKKTPAIMAESMQIGAKYGQDSVAKRMPDLEKRVEEIVTKYAADLKKSEESPDSASHEESSPDTN